MKGQMDYCLNTRRIRPSSIVVVVSSHSRCLRSDIVDRLRKVAAYRNAIAHWDIDAPGAGLGRVGTCERGTSPTQGDRPRSFSASELDGAHRCYVIGGLLGLSHIRCQARDAD